MRDGVPERKAVMDNEACNFAEDTNGDERHQHGQPPAIRLACIHRRIGPQSLERQNPNAVWLSKRATWRIFAVKGGKAQRAKSELCEQNDHQTGNIEPDGHFHHIRPLII